MNNKLINNNNKIISLSIIFLIEKKVRKKVGIFFDFRSGPDPESDRDPLFPDPDPDPDQIIRIHGEELGKS